MSTVPKRGAPRPWRHGCDKPARNDLHPTMKPLALIEWAISNSTAPGQLVVDPFLGSGTAIIAAQRTGMVWMSFWTARARPASSAGEARGGTELGKADWG